jgi:hypothetical protein
MLKPNGFNQTNFWAAYVEHFGHHPKTQAEVDGTNTLLGFIAVDELLERLEWGAFLLGTVRNECGEQMQPKRERKGKPTDKVWIKYQSKYWATGFFGRGYSQLTFEGNYRQFSRALYGDDRLVQNPDLVMQPEVGYKILSLGSVRGMFRRRKNGPVYKLSDFLNQTTHDYLHARQIVNGMAGMAYQWALRYAGYAHLYEICLRAAL